MLGLHPNPLAVKFCALRTPSRFQLDDQLSVLQNNFLGICRMA